MQAITTTYLDANLMHDAITGRSVTATLHFSTYIMEALREGNSIEISVEVVKIVIIREDIKCSRVTFSNP